MKLLRLVKNLIFLGLAVAVAVGIIGYVRQEREITDLTNAASGLLSGGEYRDAAEKYLAALKTLENSPAFLRSKERIDGLRKRLAQCYLRLAENPALPLEKSLEYYRQAREQDEEVIQDPAIKRLLEKRAE
jgi:hypothetical protein